MLGNFMEFYIIFYHMKTNKSHYEGHSNSGMKISVLPQIHVYDEMLIVLWKYIYLLWTACLNSADFNLSLSLFSISLVAESVLQNTVIEKKN